MKVSIITILDNTNFGTYLQALATGLVIKDLGYDPEIVCYTRKFMTWNGQSKKLLHERGILSWLRYAPRISSILNLRNKDLDFLNKYISVTDEYVGYGSLVSNPPKADIYLTGSDQVWNSIYNRGVDKSFFLDFAPVGKKRLSYAASVGMETFPSNEIIETKELLQKYAHITVREQKAKDLLLSLGIGSDVVLDPTLLLPKDRWINMIGDKSFCDGEKFLLIYSVERKEQNKMILHYAQMIAKQKNLKIYQISYSGRSARMSGVDRFFGNATPDIFLHLLNEASYMVVSSFHGTAFSVNFNKEFITVAAGRFNSRVQNLLDITKLQSRMVSDLNVETDNLSPIDYNEVNKLIYEERKKSIALLEKYLND